jgi:hypothetical protein
MPHLESALETYRSGVGSGYVECADLARNILNKWYREKHKINTEYDERGDFD